MQQLGSEAPTVHRQLPSQAVASGSSDLGLEKGTGAQRFVSGPIPLGTGLPLTGGLLNYGEGEGFFYPGLQSGGTFPWRNLQ